MAEHDIRPLPLSREVGLSHVSIGNFLKGQEPKYANAELLARFFGVRIEWLLRGDGPRLPPFKRVNPGCPNCSALLKRALDAESRLEDRPGVGYSLAEGERCSRCAEAEARAERAERELEALKAKLRRITGDS